MDKAPAELISALRSQGTATLAILTKLLRALISTGALTRTQVIAILDAAAESAEKHPDELGGMYSKSTGLAIRQMLEAFLDSPKSTERH